MTDKPDDLPPASSDEPAGEVIDLSRYPDEFAAVLRSAAELQRVVPDAVLVGGTASVLYAGHRASLHHDHVLQLKDRYFAVLEAVEATHGWATSVRASRPPMTIMGELGGVEAGLRQLRRTVPLETQLLSIGDGKTITIPTRDEALRVKAYLIVQRNQVRDYLDVAAMADAMEIAHAATVLADVDRFYDDRSGHSGSVVSALVERLADPSPRDQAALAALPRYKRLATRWQSWSAVTDVCRELARAMLVGDC